MLKSFSLSLLVLLSSAVLAAPSEEVALYRGKVVYLDFWASWCGPCKLSFPFMQQLHVDYADQDLVILTVNLDRRRALADKFLAEVNGANLPVIWDPRGEWAEAFDVQDMPTSVLIDKTGKTRYVHAGFHQSETDVYREHIEQLIAEQE
jgi:cytochrome c biogenesis protein CcmG, thiol:disulfide interchange protein DsbE